MVDKERSLANSFPELAKEWHPTKNDDMSACDVSIGSARVVWWKGNCGHEWDTAVRNRVRGQNCPICSGRRIRVGFNDLATTNPNLVAEWDFNKNIDTTPQNVTSGSSKKVWWKCFKCGHEWLTSIQTRVRGRGCPNCATQKRVDAFQNTIVKRGSLIDTNPDIEVFWDYSKNININPNQITKGSTEKVWWKCHKCGFEWRRSIKDMVNRANCPKCVGKQLIPGFNDLLTTNPKLAKEWHPTKNGNVQPTMVKEGSNKKAWWICDKGHEWEAVINSRSQGRGCPLCSAEQQTSFPEQAAFYYLKKVFSTTINRSKLFGFEIDIYIPELNLGIEYDGQYYHSDVEKDKLKDEWAVKNNVTLLRIREPDCPVLTSSAICIDREDLGLNDLNNTITKIFGFINKRIKNINIPDIDVARDYSTISSQIVLNSKEKSIATLFPILLDEWDYNKNGNLTPDNTYPGSTKPIWWKCKICGHEWQVSPNARTNSSKLNLQGCPKCGKEKQLSAFQKSIVEKRGSLASNNPQLALEWNYERNHPLLPTECTAHSKRKVWWVCGKGHEWESSIDARSRGKGCPYCAGRKSKV